MPKIERLPRPGLAIDENQEPIMRDAEPTVVRFLNPASMPPSFGYTQVVELYDRCCIWS
jgi:hypothetical protein